MRALMVRDSDLVTPLLQVPTIRLEIDSAVAKLAYRHSDDVPIR